MNIKYKLKLILNKNFHILLRILVSYINDDFLIRKDIKHNLKAKSII